MEKRVKMIVAGCMIGGIWDQVISRLQKMGCIDLTYCVIDASPSFERLCESFKASFPNTIFHDGMEAIKGNPALNLNERSIDEPLLQRFAKHEPIVLRMFDRMDPMDCFLYRDRYRHYIRLLRYWSAVLDEINPELILFSATPHMGWDYILYILARDRGIKTLMFNINSALGKVMWSETIGGYCDRIKEAQSLLKGSEINKDVDVLADRHLQHTRRDYGKAKPGYMMMLEVLNQQENVNWSFKSPLGFLKSIVWMLIIYGRKFRRSLIVLLPPKGLHSDNYWKHPQKTFESSCYSPREIAKVERYKLKRLQQLRTCYNNLSIEPSDNDLKKPYIFVALHYQPETTSCPEGGYFADQLLMIDMLSRSIPGDWLLYVKEHYLQTRAKSSKGWQGRDPQFYVDLAKYSNVRLISLETQSFSLIDNSKAIATITGYAAWEALVRGKPALLFGRPWFGECSGAYMLKSNQDLSSAIANIRESTKKPVLSEVKNYLIAYISVSFSGFNSKWNKEASGLSADQNIDNYFRSISDYIRDTFTVEV